jgi:hypothetical protein
LTLGVHDSDRVSQTGLIRGDELEVELGETGSRPCHCAEPLRNSLLTRWSQFVDLPIKAVGLIGGFLAHYQAGLF